MMRLLRKIDTKKFFGAFGMFMLTGMAVFAADGGNPETAKWLALSSGLGLGIAAMGCGLGQGKLVANAMEGIARNPQAAKDLFTPMILGLAFIESLTIYSLIFVFIFRGAIGV